MEVKFIFFDVGYTLVNEDAVWEQRCMEQAATEEAKRLCLTPEKIWAEIEEASIQRLPQYRTVVKKYGLKYPVPYRHELEKLYPEVVPALRELSKKYVLGILANQTDGLSQRLEAYGIGRYFQHIISSWDHQVMKPDPRLFQIALDEAGCAPEKALMVGDRLDNDILPAKALGMKTAWIRKGFGGLQEPKCNSESPDFVIQSLSELIPLLD